MKKVFIILTVIIFAASFSACKSHEKCPAYGNRSSIQIEKAVVI